MVQPLHRNNLMPPTRCEPMLVQPSGDWSVFQQIFADHWDTFAHAHPRYQTPYYEGLVAKMLVCGNPEQMGSVEYRCLRCGQGTHRVAMSCKSALCLRCAKVHVDNWVSQVRQTLHKSDRRSRSALAISVNARTTCTRYRTLPLSGGMLTNLPFCKGTDESCVPVLAVSMKESLCNARSCRRSPPLRSARWPSCWCHL